MAQNIREISTEALAYLGDCVIELKVRKLLVDSGLSHSGALNRESQKYVKASAQAAAMQRLIPATFLIKIFATRWLIKLKRKSALVIF